ncbi:MAG TPA: hypothetical protein VFK51_14170 [Burkholderiales bacterium]|nr:hypothetical protein [Burkholderiales bacterium]
MSELHDPVLSTMRPSAPHDHMKRNAHAFDIALKNGLNDHLSVFIHDFADLVPHHAVQ